MSIPLAANLNLLFPPTTPWPERCARAAAAGFAYAEILNPYDAPARELRQCLDAAGLQTILINMPMNAHFGLAAVEGAQTQFQHDFDQALTTAETLGAHAIHVLAGRADGQIHLNRTTLLDNLEYALRRVEKTNIVLTLEALNRHDVPGYFYHHPAEVVRILLNLPSAQLQQQFDVYHTQREGLDVVEQLHVCLPHIAHVQIAQTPARSEPEANNTALWQALRLLRDSDYLGYVGCEYRPAQNLETGLAWLEHAQGLLSLETRHA